MISSSSNWRSILHQWKQISEKTKDEIPINGNGDFVSQYRGDEIVEVSFSHGDRLKNLVIHNTTHLKAKKKTSQKNSEIYCDTIFIFRGTLILHTDVYAQHVIQMTGKQFNQSRKALSNRPLFDQLRITNLNKWFHFPSGTEFSCQLNSTFLNNQTGLMLAAASGNRAVVELLMTANANPEASDNVGWKPLQYAIHEDQLPIVNLLLDANAQVNTEDRHGNSPLFLSAELDYSEITGRLLGSSAKTDHVNSSGETLLSTTVKFSSMEVFRLLKIMGTDINKYSPASPDEMSGSLMDAAINGDMHRLQVLFDKGTNPNAKTKVGDTALSIAAKYDQFKAVEFLIAAKANLDACGKNGQRPLQWAVRNGSVKTVRSLLDAKACIKRTSHLDGELALAIKSNQQTVTQLFLQILLAKEMHNPEKMDLPNKMHKIVNLLEQAISSNEVHLAKKLYEIGARFKMPQNASVKLFIAAYNNQEQMVRFLLSVNANLNDAIIHAAKGGHIDIIARFLAAGASVNTADDCKRTLLVHAILKNHTKLASELVIAKANIDSIDLDGMTPLMHSLMQCNETISSLLLKNGANFQVIDKIKWTPLIYATRYNQKNAAWEILKLLKEKTDQIGLSFCVGIDEMDIDGKTALIYAAIYGRFEIAKILLELGTNIKHKTNKGKNALDCAAKHGHIDLFNLLVDKYGPDDHQRALKQASRAYVKLSANHCLAGQEKPSPCEIIIVILCQKLAINKENHMRSLQYAINDNQDSNPNQTISKSPSSRRTEDGQLVGILRNKEELKGLNPDEPEANARQNIDAKPVQNRKKIRWDTTLLNFEPPRGEEKEYSDDSKDSDERKVES